MEAYYYSFERTGEPAIDAILSALAYAGKGWHSTEYWADEDSWGYGPFIQMTPEETIQAAAQEAANELARVRAEAAAEALDEAVKIAEDYSEEARIHRDMQTDYPESRQGYQVHGYMHGAKDVAIRIRRRAAELREKAGQ
jgi:hypothetical protein